MHPLHDEEVGWFKSSHSSEQGGACVEALRLSPGIAIRDSRTRAARALSSPRGPGRASSRASRPASSASSRRGRLRRGRSRPQGTFSLPWSITGGRRRPVRTRGPGSPRWRGRGRSRAPRRGDHAKA
ncbi:DUF397 domain-containing protein [Kitasatospora cathayae]|uniref:DUF397 domain-containing protein n=1 Tax=Kitasatospora cathayae TaxID=3004092 RepID=UPI002FD863C5